MGKAGHRIAGTAPAQDCPREQELKSHEDTAGNPERPGELVVKEECFG
jgi:hypothetical protein